MSKMSEADYMDFCNSVLDGLQDLIERGVFKNIEEALKTVEDELEQRGCK